MLSMPRGLVVAEVELVDGLVQSPGFRTTFGDNEGVAVPVVRVPEVPDADVIWAGPQPANRKTASSRGVLRILSAQREALLWVTSKSSLRMTSKIDLAADDTALPET